MPQGHKGLERFVLVGKNGKQASRRDQAKVALKLEAMQLEAVGLGGGIASLLLPSGKREQTKLERVRAIYEVRRVLIRGGGERAKVRSALLDSALLLELISLYPGLPKLCDFASWVCIELKNNNSPVTKTVKKLCYIALADRCSVHWWKKMFTQIRQKTRVSVIRK
jgi:hypothetical protein